MQLPAACGIQLNYAYQHVTPQILEELFRLVECYYLRDRINALLQGERINFSENKPALHTALRAKDCESVSVDGNNVMPDILKTRQQIKIIVDKMRTKQWLGFSGKAINTIINIGIGGSDLGPRFALQALAKFVLTDLQYFFISDADPEAFLTTIEGLNPATTLFIVSSKSFTTPETLYNAKKAMEWIGPNYQQHFIAVTEHIEKAKLFGIEQVLPLWSWVGGRYSFCSSINLITAIAIGFENYLQILAGARDMDEHFLQTAWSQNLPVLLALLGVWNNNFLQIHNLLFLTYSKLLEQFIPYVQQLDMESNGKSIDQMGRNIGYPSSPIIWGGSGNQAQHSYFQLLCQGTHKIAADIISLQSNDGTLINQMRDNSIKVLTNSSRNIPINHLILANCSPFTIGALTALYEHKTFVQSVIWNLNPFDQPGVDQIKREFCPN